MRKRYRVILLATILAAVVVPLGFAFSVESVKAPKTTSRPAESVVTLPVATSIVATPATLPQQAAPVPLPEGAQLIVAAGILFGVAHLVRRSARS